VTPLTPALAAAIRKRRQEVGISQEELADRAELHRTYVSLIELSKRHLTVEALDKIARGLGVTASALLVEAERATGRGRR